MHLHPHVFSCSHRLNHRSKVAFSSGVLTSDYALSIVGGAATAHPRVMGPSPSACRAG
ncbi:hypothetical protein DAEQUDRAFT_730342 [Daedalea quercina L-15889]|uniref:Uncharacterized protein n=1 Tax=Daedalea quercina L-15889 TaxID=1314783 RepID=A0A165N0T4_9APHY|nr:hypothetical protein DAEQUDRAFT_730342 [Daedalea quercina L-15889]